MPAAVGSMWSLVWASDRIARSTRRFLELLDEINRLNIEFVSLREQIDTSGPLGGAIAVIIGAIAKLERNLIIERVRHAVSLAGHSLQFLGTPVQKGKIIAFAGVGPY